MAKTQFFCRSKIDENEPKIHDKHWTFNFVIYINANEKIEKKSMMFCIKKDI